MINEDTRIHISKGLEVADLAGEKAMIDFETGKYYLLKGAANDIWDHIQTDTSVKELVDRLMEVYDVERSVCLQNTVEFLQQLHKNGFIALQ